MTHNELLSSREYWITKIQYDFFKKVYQYMEDNSLSKSELSDRLGVSKSYISQILNGSSNFSLNKLIEMSLAIGYYPQFLLAPIDIECSKEKLEEYIATIQNISKTYTSVGLIHAYVCKPNACSQVRISKPKNSNKYEEIAA